MCMCGKPTLNGAPGYSWNTPGDGTGVYPVNPPDLQEGDVLLYDEPGRCGGLDSHSHHFRVVKGRFGFALLVRHGGGDERIDLGVCFPLAINALAALDSNARYWLFLGVHSVQRHAAEQAAGRCNEKWRKAAADNRIKTRKRRGQPFVKVWIELEQAPAI